MTREKVEGGNHAHEQIEKGLTAKPKKLKSSFPVAFMAVSLGNTFTSFLGCDACKAHRSLTVRKSYDDERRMTKRWFERKDVEVSLL